MLKETVEGLPCRKWLLIFMLWMLSQQVISEMDENYQLTTTKPQGPLSATDEMLNTINDITTGSRGSLCISSSYKIVPVRIRAELFDASRQKVDLMASFLQDVGHLNDPDLLNSLIRNLVTDRSIILARVIVFAAEENQQLHTVYEAFVEKSETTFPGPIVKKIIDRIKVEQGTLERTEAVLAKYGIPINIVDKGYGIASEGGALSSDSQVPWFVDNYFPAGWNSSKFMPNISNGTFLGWWTYPYFWCLKNQWQMSYTVPLYYAGAVLSHNTESLNGLLVADVNLSNLDIHQCDQPVSTSGRLTVTDAVPAFVGTHKCHLETTECVSKAHGGWVRGSYVCQCKRGFYYPKGGNSFNGTLAEMAYLDKARFESDIYDRIYRCQKCAIGCETCVDDQPCIVPHDWTLRIILLIISCCILCLSMVVTSVVVVWRNKAVIQVTTFSFLIYILIGCLIMQFEVISYFPDPSILSCASVKWTRHLGFAITSGSVLLKAWRVSLTFRNKNSTNANFSDFQLARCWLLPIILVCLVYLSAWTAANPPFPVDSRHLEDLRAEVELQEEIPDVLVCPINWWDTSICTGELIFLLWGCWICFTTRKADSVYNEALYVSLCIYVITLIHFTIVSLEMTLFKTIGSDVEFVFIATRCELSILTTLGFIFGPKIYLILRGKGDEHDPRAKAHGVSATFSLLGVSVANDTPLDIRKENEELKEELHKLASQMQFMKIVNMEVNNPHIKQSKGSYFSPSHLQPKSNGTLVTPSLPVINGLKCSLPKAEIVTDPIIQLDNGDTGGIYLGDEDEPKIEEATRSEKDHIIDEDPLKTGEEEIVIGTPKFEGEYEWL